jgi:hypothetical protein
MTGCYAVTNTFIVIKRLFDVNAIFIKHSSTRWVTRRHFYHTLPRLILLTPGVRFLLSPLNAELNPIRHLLALAGAHHFVHVSRLRVNRKIVSQLSVDNSN